MKKTNFKFIIILLLICLLILLNTKSYATNINDLPDLPDEVKDYEYFFICEITNSGKYKLLYSHKPFTYEEKCTAFYKGYGVDCIYFGIWDYYKYDSSSSSKTWEYVNNESDLHISGFLKYNEGQHWYTMIYTNHDILNKKDGSVVFQKTPQNMVTIPAIQQVEEIPQQVGEILKMTIPVGLIVLSIGLLIYLTRLVILRMT